MISWRAFSLMSPNSLVAGPLSPQPPALLRPLSLLRRSSCVCIPAALRSCASSHLSRRYRILNIQKSPCYYTSTATYVHGLWQTRATRNTGRRGHRCKACSFSQPLPSRESLRDQRLQYYRTPEWPSPRALANHDLFSVPTNEALRFFARACIQSHMRIPYSLTI